MSTSSGVHWLQRGTHVLVHSKIRSAVDDLRLEYPKVRDSLAHGSGDFGKVDKDVDVILKLEPRNGHGLYYQGEIKRIKNKLLFDSQSCIIASRLASDPGPLHPFETDFLRYLDIEKALPDEDRRGNYTGETCYSRTLGYCDERTAWINHLLANDFFEEGMLSHDPAIKADKLHRALKYAETARDNYRDEHNQPGFTQCTPTTALITKAQEALASLNR